MEQFVEMLVSEIGLDEMHARVFLHVTANGASTVPEIATNLGIGKDDAQHAVESLMRLGAFIDMPGSSYEAMHPRFTVVNMYRRRCESTGAAFGRNKTVDSIGAALERHYEHARAK